MTIAQWLVDSMIKLHQSEVPNGRTDALVLLADLFHKDKSWVHAHPEIKLEPNQLEQINQKLAQRLERIPLAYIRGFSEFYGRKFMVGPDVLVPRPESESIVELLKDLPLEKPRIADIGTGSGCLGISAALELPRATVDLYDIDENALKIARQNLQKYSLTLACYQSDLLANLQNSYDIVLANLPYVPETLVTSPEITKEPAIALFSGADGLSHYRKFWQQIAKLKHKPKYILTESLEQQRRQMGELAQPAGYRAAKTEILVQLFEIDTDAR